MFSLLFSLTVGLACHPVTSDRITGQDLAAAVPEFKTLPAAEHIAFAPSLGTRRVFTTDELARIARSHGITATPASSVCFAIPAAPLDRQRVEDAIRLSLHPSDAEFQIVEVSAQPVPEGDIVFPKSGRATAPSSSEAPITWRGYVVYSSGRRYDIWARVKLGPPEINKGDLIRVEAHNGAAKLALDGQAQASGRVGDRIAVKNPTSGKLFTATVAAPGLAVINLSWRTGE